MCVTYCSHVLRTVIRLRYVRREDSTPMNRNGLSVVTPAYKRRASLYCLLNLSCCTFFYGCHTPEIIHNLCASEAVMGMLLVLDSTILCSLGIVSGDGIEKPQQ